MGNQTGLLRGIISAFADTILDVGGTLMCRSEKVHAVGEVNVHVDGLYRWPASGRFSALGRVYVYTSATVSPTSNVLHGVKEWFPYVVPSSTGLIDALAQSDIVYYFGKDFNDLDLVRAGFLVDTAVGNDLDTLARNYGISRFAWMDEATFRKFLKVALYLDATTIYSVEKVLDAVVGAGSYELWDTPLSPVDHHKVFIELEALPNNIYRGKTFLCGGEEQTRTGTNTVKVGTATTTIQAVYGVYARTVSGFPGERQGNTNYLLTTYGGTLDALNPRNVFTAIPTFELVDVGRSIIIHQTGLPDEIWNVITYNSAQDIGLGRKELNATVSGGAPTILSATQPVFESWMVGCEIQVTSANSAINIQTGTIASVDTEYTVTLSGMSGAGWGVSDVGIVFIIWPSFSTNPSITFELIRYQISGNEIKTVATLPNDLYVDYATIPSAQLVESPEFSGEAQYPFYLYDDLSNLTELLETILAAGVHPVVTRA